MKGIEDLFKIRLLLDLSEINGESTKTVPDNSIYLDHIWAIGKVTDKEWKHLNNVKAANEIRNNMEVYL